MTVLKLKSSVSTLCYFFLMKNSTILDKHWLFCNILPLSDTSASHYSSTSLVQNARCKTKACNAHISSDSDWSITCNDNLFERGRKFYFAKLSYFVLIQKQAFCFVKSPCVILDRALNDNFKCKKLLII